MNKNGVVAVVVVVVAIVLIGLWAMRSGSPNTSGRLDCNSAPPPPTNLSTTKQGDNATLHWTAPGGSETVATYVIEAGDKPGLNNQGVYVAPGSATSFERKTIPPGTYYVHMFSRNACGTSPQSSEVVVTIP